MNKIVLTLICMSLIGCATTGKLPEVVKIPIAVECQVDTPAAPQYQFGNLKPSDSIWEKVKTLLSDRQLALAYQQELEAALAACK